MKFRCSKQLWFHVDCDSFFAACEILRCPELSDKYVCVGGDIIVAASYNAKYLGVNTWTPIWEARRMLPRDKTYFFPPDIAYYAQVSEKLMKILSHHSEKIEVFSIDEAFCNVSWVSQYYGMTPHEYALFLQKKILSDLGISVTIGWGNTRLRAKIFSKLRKPFWVSVYLDSDEISQVFQSLPLNKIPFIGKKLEARIARHIETIEDFRRTSFSYFQRIIGVNATRLWLELNGVNAVSFSKNAFRTREGSVQKSFSKTRSFNHTLTSDKSMLQRKLWENLDIFFEELYKKRCEIRNIIVTLRKQDFTRESRIYEFPDYTLSRKEVYRAVEKLLTEIYSPEILYRGTGVITSDMRSFEPKQLSLLDIESQNFQKDIHLASVFSSLRRKYGKESIRVWVQSEYKNCQKNVEILELLDT